uniref:Uncharacterized protein n=1 Tax=Rhizophora mucronata TaxID=61149 RepID=A0A2P2NXD3_RHIMU
MNNQKQEVKIIISANYLEFGIHHSTLSSIGAKMSSIYLEKLNEY